MSSRTCQRVGSDIDGFDFEIVGDEVSFAGFDAGIPFYFDEAGSGDAGDLIGFNEAVRTAGNFVGFSVGSVVGFNVAASVELGFNEAVRAAGNFVGFSVGGLVGFNMETSVELGFEVFDDSLGDLVSNLIDVGGMVGFTFSVVELDFNVLDNTGDSAFSFDLLDIGGMVGFNVGKSVSSNAGEAVCFCRKAVPVRLSNSICS